MRTFQVKTTYSQRSGCALSFNNFTLGYAIERFVQCAHDLLGLHLADKPRAATWRGKMLYIPAIDSFEALAAGCPALVADDVDERYAEFFAAVEESRSDFMAAFRELYEHPAWRGFQEAGEANEVFSELRRMFFSTDGINQRFGDSGTDDCLSQVLSSLMSLKELCDRLLVCDDEGLDKNGTQALDGNGNGRRRESGAAERKSVCGNGQRPGKESQSLGPQPDLTDRQKLVLQALLELAAVDLSSRRTTQQVACTAGGRAADAEEFKAPVAELVRLGFVKSKRGRKGGCWLTEQGKRQAQKEE